MSTRTPRFPAVLELEFDTAAEAEEFDRAAATHGMSRDEFLAWLFESYQRAHPHQVERQLPSNVHAFPPRKPMARADAKRVLLEAVKELLEEAGR